MNKENEKLKSKDGVQNSGKYLRYGLVGVIAVIVIAAVLGIYFSYSKGYIATIGKEKVSLAEFKFFLKQQKDDMLAKAGNPDPNTFWNTKIDGESAIDIAKKKALESARELKIQVIKAKEQKITLEKKDLESLDAGIKQIIAQYDSKSKANEEFKKTNGVGIDEFREIYKGFILRSKLYQKETGAMEVSEDELKKNYDDNAKSFDKVTVRHVLITTNGKDGKRSPEESRKLAEEVLKKVRAGEDMKALAKQYSEDPGVAQNEGEYTFGKYEAYVQQFKEWALKANVGDTDIVESIYGYHVMMLEKRVSTPFDEVKNNIKSEVVDKMYTDKLNKWKKDPGFDIVKNQAVYDTIK